MPVGPRLLGTMTLPGIPVDPEKPAPAQRPPAGILSQSVITCFPCIYFDSYLLYTARHTLAIWQVNYSSNVQFPVKINKATYVRRVRGGSFKEHKLQCRWALCYVPDSASDTSMGNIWEMVVQSRSPTSQTRKLRNLARSEAGIRSKVSLPASGSHMLAWAGGWGGSSG